MALILDKLITMTIEEVEVGGVRLSKEGANSFC